MGAAPDLIQPIEESVGSVEAVVGGRDGTSLGPLVAVLAAVGLVVGGLVPGLGFFGRQRVARRQR